MLAEKHDVEVPDFDIPEGDFVPITDELFPEDPEIQDLRGFVADGYAAMESSGIEFGSMWTDAEMSEVNIDGDSATAVLEYSVEGNERTEPIGFTMTEDGWLIDMTITEDVTASDGVIIED